MLGWLISFAAIPGSYSMTIPPSTVDFCTNLAVQFTDIRELLDKHMSDNDELLPHVFFGDVTRWVLMDKPARSRVVELLEWASNSRDLDLQNLIAASFTENLETVEELERAISGVDAPCIRAEWERQHN
jgi:hypothetical protein